MAGTVRPTSEGDGLDGIVGSWRIGALLGRGAYGQVFAGEPVTSQLGPVTDRVAIKVVDPPPILRPAVMAEARSGMTMTHPHLLPTLDVFEHDGRVIMVLELADESLAQRLERTGPLGAVDGLVLMRHVAGALCELHQTMRLVHNDLKPENILDVHGTWKLADFGIARPLYEDRSMAPGQANTLYRPPEAGRTDERHVTTPGYDLWAFGLTMHLALSGEDPRGIGDLDDRWLASIRLLDERASLPVHPDLPRGLGDVLSACLARREDRCSASKLVSLLDLADTRPDWDRPRPAPARRRRTRRWAATLGALLAVVLVLFLVRAYFGHHALPAAPPSAATDAELRAAADRSPAWREERDRVSADMRDVLGEDLSQALPNSAIGVERCSSLPGALRPAADAELAVRTIVRGVSRTATHREELERRWRGLVHGSVTATSDTLTVVASTVHGGTVTITATAEADGSLLDIDAVTSCRVVFGR